MNQVIKVSDETKKKLIEHYKDKIREKTPPYAIFQAEEFDTVITLYESGKVMFQGTSADVDADMWKQIDGQDTEVYIDNNEYYNISAIGSDEVGTGDYFGPIIVTAAYVSISDIEFLKQYKITDSKKMLDDNIRKFAPKILQKIKYKSIMINNAEYNSKYSKETNMNKIKAVMHNKVLSNLKDEIKTDIDMIIIDEFTPERKYYEYLSDVPNPLKGIIFLQKAESKNMAVAVASVISRYLFLLEFDKLSDTYHIPLPKGSGSNVDIIGKELVSKHGKEILDKIAKKNFSNTGRILETMIF